MNQPSDSDSLRILLVEDHEDSATVTRILLERKGYTILVAGSAEAAREISTKQGYDLVICDIKLKDGDGWELVQELKATRQVKAIAVSGFGTSSDIAHSLQAGFDRHITKPYDIHLLLSTIVEVAYEQC